MVAVTAAAHRGSSHIVHHAQRSFRLKPVASDRTQEKADHDQVQPREASLDIDEAEALGIVRLELISRPSGEGHRHGRILVDALLHRISAR